MKLLIFVFSLNVLTIVVYGNIGNYCVEICLLKVYHGRFSSSLLIPQLEARSVMFSKWLTKMAKGDPKLSSRSERSRIANMRPTGVLVAHGEPGYSDLVHHVKRLRNFDFLLGFPRSNPQHFSLSVLSEEKCLARSSRDAAAFCFASHGSEESSRKQHRIEELFMITYQRGMGRTKALALAAARGVLADKKRLPVKWAEFVRKQCQQNRKADRSFVLKSLRSRGVHERQNESA